MSLLREIQDAAVDGTTPLAVVLRKCMVLAARLGHEPFKKWVDEELNGYPPDADLPEYRRIDHLISIGSFAGPLGRQLKNVPLPLAPVPPHVRDRYEKAEFREGVAKLTDMATPQEGGGKLAARWPGDLVSLVADKYYQGYVLLEAHIEIPTSAVAGVLDSVRNKVLKFALEIEQQNPAAGDVAPGTRPVPEERVAQIFHTYIMGGAQNVAVGSPGAVQHAQQLQVGDLEGLKRFLADHGVQTTDLAELESAIAEDPKPKAGEPLGRRVASWMGTMISKAASGAWKIGISAATEILSAALKAYYGLP
jgi:hypothetical protein